MPRHTDGVNDPAEHHLEHAPQAAALPQLFERDGLSSVRVVVGAQRTDNAVDRMQQDPSRPPPARPPLSETQEAVHKHVVGYLHIHAMIGLPHRR